MRVFELDLSLHLRHLEEVVDLIGENLSGWKRVLQTHLAVLKVLGLL